MTVIAGIFLDLAMSPASRQDMTENDNLGFCIPQDSKLFFPKSLRFRSQSSVIFDGHSSSRNPTLGLANDRASRSRRPSLHHIRGKILALSFIDAYDFGTSSCRNPCSTPCSPFPRRRQISSFGRWQGKC